MILDDASEDFVPAFHTVGIYVRVFDEILLLLRHPRKPQANKWCVPGGKMQVGESVLRAIRRELKEETGISAEQNCLSFCSTVRVRYSDFDFFYSTFSVQLPSKPLIELNKEEHSSHSWFTHTKALTLPLIEDEAVCLQKFFRAKPIS